MRHAVLLALAVTLAACSRPPSGDDGPPALLDAWTALQPDPTSESPFVGFGECDGFTGYVTTLGARGLACVLHDRRGVGLTLSLYDGDAWSRAPHTATPGAFQADLLSDDFAHYETDFVEWLADNAIPGEDDPALRALTAPIYRAQFQRMARVYWLVYEDLTRGGYPGAAPPGVTRDYAVYLETGVLPASGADGVYPGFTMTAFSDRNLPLAERLAGPGGNVFGPLYEANTAVGFWLRRRADGSHAAFRDGLRRLLGTYDAAWLAAV